MSAQPKPFEEPHMEKQIMDEPQEEFVNDQSRPSVPMQSEKKDDGEPVGVHAAGHQEKKSRVFEEGVEG